MQMTKFASTIIAVVLGLVVLSAVSPALARLADALVPLVIVVGIVAGALRWLWFYTR